MQIDTRDYPTAVVLSLYTGRLLCDFSAMHELAEFLVGTPVWTHQFAHRPFVDEMKAALVKQLPLLAGVDASSVTTENWQAFRDAWLGVLGPILSVHSMGEPGRYADGWTEPLKHIGEAMRKTEAT